MLSLLAFGEFFFHNTFIRLFSFVCGLRYEKK
jgi:hypothetical protein